MFNIKHLLDRKPTLGIPLPRGGPWGPRGGPRGPNALDRGHSGVGGGKGALTALNFWILVWPGTYFIKDQ